MQPVTLTEPTKFNGNYKHERDEMDEGNNEVYWQRGHQTLKACVRHTRRRVMERWKRLTRKRLGQAEKAVDLGHISFGLVGVQV